MKRHISLFVILYTICFLLIGGKRLTAQPGSLDSTFNPGIGTNAMVRTIAIQDDGKIIIGGAFTAYNGTPRNYIARLNTDGSLDASFNPGAGTNNWVYTIAIQDDGKIIICGPFDFYNGITRNKIARLNTDGSLDASFNPGTGANGYIEGIAIQGDGKILIGGAFTSYNSTPINRIARLNTDGSLDASFNHGTGANFAIRTIVIQDDGKIIISGFFTSYYGTTINHIARLNTDGSLDASFNPGTGASGSVYSTSIQGDGKIIIGGGFTYYNDTPRNNIARLNTDGSLDASFNPGTGASGWVYNTAIQDDGKIIIGGAFTSYDGTIIWRIARLNTDGSLDASFNLGTGANDYVLSAAIQDNGKIIIGGYFSLYNGTLRYHIARILGGAVNIKERSGFPVEVNIYPNPSEGIFNVLINAPLVTTAKVKIFSLKGEMVYQTIVKKPCVNHKEQINISGLPPGEYILRVETNSGWVRKEIIVL